MAFGSFVNVCAQSPLPLCFLLGPPSRFTSSSNPLLLPTCSARSIDVGNTIIFQAATDFAHIAALFMTAIMIFHVRSKFTAVGRKEILTFFYVYLVLSVISLVLDAGVLPASNQGAFAWFVAVQNGLIGALCASLLVNGFVGFQLYEDGTNLSVWLLRASAALMFGINFLVSLLTFKGWAGLGPESTTGLFVVLYVVNAIELAVYLVMQVILVVNTLQDRWPLWDLGAAVFFFTVGQVILYAVGRKICEAINHYLDGLFFATVCNLLAVMMVYKYWDSITKEDLEFSVGTRMNTWAVEQKEPFLDTQSELNHRTSFYGSNLPPNTRDRDSMYDASSLDYAPPPVNQSAISGYTQSPTGYAPSSGMTNTNTHSSRHDRYSSHARDPSSQGRRQSSHGRPSSHGRDRSQGRLGSSHGRTGSSHNGLNGGAFGNLITSGQNCSDMKFSDLDLGRENNRRSTHVNIGTGYRDEMDDDRAVVGKREREREYAY